LAKGKFNQDNVGLIVKTGASEAFEKLPAQIETVLGCAQNLLIVSDLDFELAGHHIHDVLQDVSPAIRDNNPVFEIYLQQRRLRDEGYTMEQLGVTSSSHNVAWELDKFKFLPMVYKAYTDIPNKDWYVFLEADTYLNWNNLLAWLSQLDASEKLYVGSPSFMAGTKFNHGGSGYILSRAAIRAFAEEYPAVASIWDARTTNECCGDYVLTLALKEFGVPVSGVWPMLSGEPPLEIPFGPALWCQSVITLHHVTSTDLRKMWSFERELDRTQVRKYSVSNTPPTNVSSAIYFFKIYTSIGFPMAYRPRERTGITVVRAVCLTLTLPRHLPTLSKSAARHVRTYLIACSTYTAKANADFINASPSAKRPHLRKTYTGRVSGERTGLPHGSTHIRNVR